MSAMLGYDVPIHGETGRKTYSIPHACDALRSNTSDGKLEVILLLLQHGANPIRIADKFRNQPVGYPGLQNPLSPDLYFIGRNPQHVRVESILAACLAFVEADTKNEHRDLLLRHFVTTCNVSMARRLLQCGYRMSDPPLGGFKRDDACDMIDLCESFNITLDPVILQTDALKQGHVKTLWHLVNSKGPCIPERALMSVLWMLISSGTSRHSSI